VADALKGSDALVLELDLQGFKRWYLTSAKSSFPPSPALKPIPLGFSYTTVLVPLVRCASPCGFYGGILIYDSRYIVHKAGFYIAVSRLDCFQHVPQLGILGA